MRKVEVRQLAREKGEKHFTHTCKKHGEGPIHYVSSGRCMQCTAEGKDPVKQAQYWQKWYKENRIKA